MAEKLYLDAQELLEDSFRLAAKVFQSGFRPNVIVAVWRGGAPMGIAVQELLAFKGIETDHIAIRTSSYHGIDNQQSTVKVYNLNYLVKRFSATDRLLIVDDVYDTGRSIEAIVEHLSRLTRRNMPQDVRVAVPYYKPDRNQTDRIPDYFLHATDRWIKFPHSLEGLSSTEVRAHRPDLADIVEPAQRRRE